ncbi:hypothetical protein J2797_005085 [Paraburkholderia terricola]|uniref:hypothetical protein n=1 Tax=Paraburkholderia terricola TaxID=169427 RepID=UPI002860D94E|nr:hypothetical protein [Paraburkholderia terricola]MDR6495169.1 hypothetical protein [Paraburkholderia terricola]
MTTETNGAALPDDGEYFMQPNGNYPATAGNGFLMRRCCLSVIRHRGIECLGGYDLKPDGNWLVDIATHYDLDTDADCRVIGRFENRLDAIDALWQHRHEVAIRHSRY